MIGNSLPSSPNENYLLCQLDSKPNHIIYPYPFLPETKTVYKPNLVAAGGWCPSSLLDAVYLLIKFACTHSALLGDFSHFTLCHNSTNSSTLRDLCEGKSSLATACPCAPIEGYRERLELAPHCVPWSIFPRMSQKLIILKKLSHGESYRAKTQRLYVSCIDLNKNVFNTRNWWSIGRRVFDVKGLLTPVS